MNNHPKPLCIFVFLLLIGSTKQANANPLAYQFLHLIIHYYHYPVIVAPSTILMDEICDNGIDDDGDGAIDAADSDCQCNPDEPPNLIPNGNFSAHTSCCAALGPPGFNCLENWVALRGSADYISDACPDTDLRPDVKSLAQHFDTADEDAYIHLILSSGNGRYFNESMGICFDEPLLPGNTYTFSFDIANLRNQANPRDVRYTFFGIPKCENLTDYDGIINNPITGSCVSGSPFERIATIQTGQTRNEWVQQTFEVSPLNVIEAFFFAIDCDNPTPLDGLNISLIMDNFSMVQQVEMGVPKQTTLAEVIPVGGSYNFGGQIITTAGNYVDSLQTTMGCDSIVTLNLVVTNGVVEDCTNGIDDDGDGLADGFDADCACLTGADTVISNEIIVDGNPCEGNLRFIIEGGAGLPIHWFKDSVPLVRTTGGNLNFNALNISNAAGTYHGKVTFNDGNCQLAGPLYYDGVIVNADKSIVLCEGNPYQFGDTLITTSGIYQRFFPSQFNGCDSLITLTLDYSDNIYDSLEVTINQGESFTFKEQTLMDSGIYLDTILGQNGACDTILTLDLTVFAGEICNNLIDDDGDGLIDAFDEDCRCNSNENLVSNGDFEQFEEDCCSGSVANVNICVNNWPHTRSTPDFIHPTCIGSAINGEANYYDVPLEGAFMGILISYANSPIFPELNGTNSETIGQCLTEPLIAGETYTISFDMGIKGNLDGTPKNLEAPLFFTVNGISDCNRLGEYLPTTTFCDSGLPFQQLAFVNLMGLNRGWNPQTFTFTPSTDLEAIFVMGDCDLDIEAINIAIALVDNLVIQQAPTPIIPNEIIVAGNPCDENNMLRFSVEPVLDATYQWYLDSIPQTSRTQASLTYGLNANIVGTHHVYVTFPDGQCQLIGPYEFDYPERMSNDTLTLCQGESVIFNNTSITTAGDYSEIFSSIINGCDSTANLVVFYEETPTSTLTDTITEGQSYDFNGTALTTTGIYGDTLSTMRGCDSLIRLNLVVTPPEGELCNNNIDDDGDGLIDVFDPDCQCENVDPNTPATTINIDGPHCDKSTQIFVAVITNAAYQWYKDSVLLVGESSPRLSLSQEREDIAGQYHVSIIHSDGTCQLLAFSTDTERPVDVDFLTIANICAGTSYQFGDSFLTESGIYVQTFTNPTNGCDSMLTLDLNVLSSIIGDTLIVNQNIGTSYTFHGEEHSTTGIFQANLTAASGCDSLTWLNLILTDPCANLTEIIVEWADAACEIAANGWINLETQNGNPPFEYTIDGGANYVSNNVFENLSIGDYDIAVRDNNGCVSTNFITIQSTESNLFIELPEDTILTEGQSISLAIVASNFDPQNYQWVSDASINCPDCPNIRLSPTISGSHTLRVTDTNGCQATDAIFIELKPIPKLYIPNTFSPNADGLNDVFKIEGTPEALARVAELSIYNRWGNLVFQQQKTENSSFLEWDGSINSQVAMANVYMYVVTWVNERGEKEVLTGDFILVK